MTDPQQQANQAPRMFRSMRVVRVTEWGNSDVMEVFSDVSMPEPENDQVGSCEIEEFYENGLNENFRRMMLKNGWGNSDMMEV